MNKIRLIGAVALAAAWSVVSASAGEALPTPVNGVVTLQSGTTYTVTENTSLAGISEISVVEGSTLEYDVAESQTLEVTCKVKGKGLLVKNGPGLAIHACSDFDNGKAYYIEYPGYTIINAGTLRGPAMAADYNYSTFYVGRLVVNNPGVYDIASPGRTEVYGLWGDGEVTCSRAGAYNQLAINTDKGKAGETYCAPSQFSGLLSGSALRNSPAGYFDILSSDNTCSGEQLIGNGADVGIMKFGDNNVQNGSLGKPSITCRGTVTKLRYLGTGETATKGINYSAGGVDLEIDAGATGGLTLAGAVTASELPAGYAGHKLILSGDNAEPCALTGTMKDWAVKSGVTTNYPISVYKRGTGTWKLASSSGDYSGLVAVENGTLQFDTVAAKGKNSSLGNATNTTDCAVLLGAKDTVGTLEYVGSPAVACPDRTIAVTGKGGRLSASAGTVDWTGVAAAAPTTLYLGGTADGNVLRDASGAVSVVQDGTGRWFVDGSSTFSGALTANAGELVARADVTKRTFDFKWFKFVIRAKNRVRPDGQEVTDGNVELEELGFFDENGNRILDGFEFVTTNPEQANKSIPFPDLSDIQPGQYGWLPNAKSTTYNAYGNRDADCLFDNKVSGSGPGLCIVYQANKPLIDDPGTWYTLLVRMPADAPKVATFDVMSKYGGTSDRGVTCWTMMGSEDGVLWYTIKTYDDPDNANPPASSQWYSDHVKTFDTHVGYSATTVEEATDGRFPNVEKVSVGAGATLRMVGEADFKLLEMNGGAWKADTGMSYAFGALDVLAAGSTMLVPDGATVTFGDSSARTWPANVRLDITTEGSGKVDFAGLSLAQMRQVYVNGVSYEEQETERIVFLGDSITCGGYWEYVLQDFEATRNPGKLIRNYNAGIAGDTASGALGRLDRDVFARNPARVYVMFGMNDVGISNYCETPSAAQLAAQAKSMAAFAQSMSNIVDRVLARGVAVTLVTPTPFDEYGTSYTGANHVNANEQGLAAAAEIVRNLAAYRGTDLIDLHAPMTAIYKAGAVKFNRDDRVHPEWRGHVLMSALVWKQLGYDAAPYSERTLAAPGGRATFAYAPDGLPFPQNEDFAAVKTAAPDLIASLNREIVSFTDLPQGTFTLKANGVAIGDYTTAQLTAGVDLGEAATPSQTAAQAAWAKMKSLVGKDYALRYVVAMEIRAKALDPSIDLEDYDAVCALLDQWVEGLTSQQDYYRGVVKLYKDNKQKVAQVEEESTQIWRELNDLGVPQPYELSIEQKGMLEIPANQGDVVKTAAEIEEAEAISIGAGSRLVIRDAGSADEPIEIKANISGAGGLFVGSAYVELSGDNRVWTGEKMFTNAFVTISSRYGLGSPDVELKNYLDKPEWGYLHFVGNGLTNDVPIHAYGGGYNSPAPATAFTANAADPFVQNGGLCFVEPSTAKLGNYELKGGFYGVGNSWLGSATGCEPWISGPFKVTSGTYLVVADFTLHLVGDPASTGWFSWLYLRSGTVICESENVWGKSLGLGEHGSGAAKSSGTFDMNGYDQTFETVRFYNNISVERDWTDLKLYVTSAEPATLTMTGNGDRYREGVRFTGAAGFRYVGTGAWTNTLFRSTTTGTLTVGDGTNKGEVFFDWGARWDGDVVLDGGRFGCDTSNGIGHKAKVTISNGGKLIVPAGVNLRVREVTVDGQTLETGVYQNVDWIEGEGTVRCGKFGLSVIVR